MPKAKPTSAKRSPIAANLVTLRNARGWKQSDLAKRLGTHLSNIARIETGVYKPNLEIIEKAMQVFGVSADDLIKPVRKLSEREQMVKDLVSDLDALDMQQVGTVRALVTTYKAGGFARILHGPRPIDDPAVSDEQ